MQYRHVTATLAVGNPMASKPKLIKKNLPPKKAAPVTPIIATIAQSVRSITVELPPMIADRLEGMAKERGTDISTMVRVSLHNLARRSNFYHLDTKLGFGKYGEEVMEAVIRCDPGYVSWALRAMERFNLSEDCLALLSRIEAGTEQSEAKE